MMKKMMMLMIGLTGFAAANAQSIKIAPEAGINISNVRLHDTRGRNDDYVSADPRAGLKIGGIVDIGLTRVLSLQPGIFYSMKGYKLDEYRTAGVVLTKYDAKTRATLNYLELPLNLMFKFGRPRNPRFIMGGGAYVAYAVSGRVKYGPYVGSSGNTTEDLHFGNDEKNDDYRSADVGGQLFAGLLLPNGGYLRAQYQLGFSNIDAADNDNYTVRNNTASVTLGFMLGGRR